MLTADRDRQRFLETLTEACQKTGWQVHAFCLMSNHFHLVVETPQPNLVAGMKWFLGAYTSRYNRRHKEFGHEGVSQRECNILLTADREGAGLSREKTAQLEDETGQLLAILTTIAKKSKAQLE